MKKKENCSGKIRLNELSEEELWEEIDKTLEDLRRL